ncbi:MAG: MFS transporter [Gammaproteobacteria bacterium]|nr:MFS transporter [Gammaproteobacteria bacterium]
MTITKGRARMMLVITMLISFLGTAGIALPYPVLAPYFLDYPANELTHFAGIDPKLLLGLALALYPLGMLVGGSFIGALSDLYGRRLILVITLAGTSVGYILTAYAVIIESFPLFIVSRLLSGVCEGNVSIARAMAAELHPHIEKVKAMSMLFSTVYAGWLFGPLAGGYLMALGIGWVFGIAALATALTIVVVLLGVAKHEEKHQETRTFRRLIIEENSFSLLKERALWPIFSFYFIYTLAINLFYEFYPVWLVEKLSYDSQQIAWMTVVITSCMIFSTMFIATRLINLVGQFNGLIASVLILSVSMLLLTYSTENIVYVLFGLMGAFIAINNAVTPTYMSDRFGHFGQGKVMGLQTSLFFLGNVIMAIMGSLVSLLSVDATMIAASGLFLLSVIWFILSGERSRTSEIP